MGCIHSYIKMTVVVYNEACWKLYPNIFTYTFLFSFSGDKRWKQTDTVNSTEQHGLWSLFWSFSFFSSFFLFCRQNKKVLDNVNRLVIIKMFTPEHQTSLWVCVLGAWYVSAFRAGKQSFLFFFFFLSSWRIGRCVKFDINYAEQSWTVMGSVLSKWRYAKVATLHSQQNFTSSQCSSDSGVT